MACRWTKLPTVGTTMFDSPECLIQLERDTDRMIYTSSSYNINNSDYDGRQNMDQVSSCTRCQELQNAEQKLASVEMCNRILRKDMESQEKRHQTELAQLRDQSAALTEHMAKVHRASGQTECIQDEFSNRKLASALEGLCKNNWSDVYERLEQEHPEIDEIERIQTVTHLIKTTYQYCVRFEMQHIKDFLFLGNDDKVPSETEEPELYRVRRNYGQTETSRKTVADAIVKEVFDDDHIESRLEKMNITRETKLILEQFVKDFAHTCWLMSISNPKLVLNFDVIDRQYDAKETRERFKRYSTQVPLVDLARDPGTVVVVVWPAVELENKTGYLTKGEVITVVKAHAAPKQSSS